MPLQTYVLAQQAVAASGNQNFLTRLPRESQQRIVSQASRVTLHKEERLLEAGAVLTWSYLPCAGLISLQTMTEEEETVEVAMVGNEGVVGLPVGPTSTTNPHTAVVILPGEALRVRADILDKEFGRDPALQRALIQYWHELTILIAQGSVCHRFHTARQRLASWLLAASDRTQSVRIQMTQERLGDALGLQRTGVTAASIALQDAGADQGATRAHYHPRPTQSRSDGMRVLPITAHLPTQMNTMSRSAETITHSASLGTDRPSILATSSLFTRVSAWRGRLCSGISSVGNCDC